MKKSLILILFMIVFAACHDSETEPVIMEQDVQFTAIQVLPGEALKSTLEWECKELEPDYAHIIIGGQDFLPAVFRLDGQLYTQAIKLPVGSYTVEQFLLMDDNGTPGNPDDDEIVMGTPENGSDYAVYVSETIDFDFEVQEFTKVEIPVEVLCFQDAEYEAFGFDWFSISEIAIREMCFFGDFCVKHPADYTGSYYANQSTGLQIDMPAIFRLEVKKNGTPVPGSPFTNASSEAEWGVGSPVCVQYPDNLNIDGEVFTFDLWIYVIYGNNFVFKHFHTWTTVDEVLIPAGADGVVDFVLGNCNLTEPDLHLPPYQNLPLTANVTITNPADPGYWKIYVNTVSPAGTYDLPVHVNLAGWCGDINHAIANGNHNMNVHSSLYSKTWPAGMPFSLGKIARVNWLFNHLEYYDMDQNTLTNAQGDIIQGAIWNILNGTPAAGMSLQMATDAGAHEDFFPLPGGWAAVLFIKSNQPQKYQLIFTIVDP